MKAVNIWYEDGWGQKEKEDVANEEVRTPK